MHGLEGDEVHDSGRDRCMEWRAIGAWNRGWITESDRCLGCRLVRCMIRGVIGAMEWRAIGAWNRGWMTESDRCLGCRVVQCMCWRVDRCMQWRAMRCMV